MGVVGSGLGARLGSGVGDGDGLADGADVGIVVGEAVGEVVGIVVGHNSLNSHVPVSDSISLNSGIRSPATRLAHVMIASPIITCVVESLLKSHPKRRDFGSYLFFVY